MERSSALGQGSGNGLRRELLSLLFFLASQSRTPSVFPFLTVTVLPDLIKSLGREIHLKIVRNSIMGYKYFRNRIPVVVDDRCPVSVELQQYTWAIFHISPCLSQVMNHQTFGE